jgi:beta-mannosidase
MSMASLQRLRATVFLLLFLPGIIFSQSIKFNKWEFREEEAGHWLPGTAEVNLLNDLYRNSVLPAPELIIADSVTANIESKNWIYRCAINVTDPLPVGSLVLGRVDTYADIYLNDVLLGSTDNAFTSYEFPVEGLLRKGRNTLRIHFHSPVTTDLPRALQHTWTYPSDSDTHPQKTSVFTRKPAYHYGWDFTPRMVRFGVEYIFFRPKPGKGKPVLRDLSVSTWKIEGEKALVDLVMDIETAQAGEIEIIPGYFPESPMGDTTGQEVVYAETSLKFGLDKGRQELNVPLEINGAGLWWPSGMGKQQRYRLVFRCRSGKGPWQYIDSLLNEAGKPNPVMIALRTVTVDTTADATGGKFQLVVNGKPLFAKGFNIIADHHEDTVSLSEFPGVNLVRIWGGGNYGTDHFYDYCDRHGILVWQDFMFANTMYPGDTGFLGNVSSEAEYQVKRLRKHPSLALWCGNNEVEVAWKNWGWQQKYGYTPTDSLQLMGAYNRLFRELLPSIVAANDPGKFYFSSTPMSNWGRKEDFDRGDNHFWGVYHGEMPLEAYNEFVPRFASEYGMQSYPTMQLIKRVVSSDALYLESPSIKELQKSYKGNRLLLKYMEMYLGAPAGLEDFVYKTQVLQAEAMRIAIASHRRNSARCAGTLLWQFNDVATAASWSLFDSGGKKAAYSVVQENFKGSLLSAVLENDTVAIWYSSEDEKPVNNALLNVKILGLGDNRLIKAMTWPVTTGHGSQLLYKASLTDLTGTSNRRQVYVRSELKYDGNATAPAILFTDTLKNLDYPAPVLYCRADLSGNLLVTVSGTAPYLCLEVDGEKPAVYWLSTMDHDTFIVPVRYRGDLPIRARCLGHTSLVVNMQ